MLGNIASGKTSLLNAIIKEYYKDRLVSPMIWEYSETDALKGDLAIMDLLSTNKWERPVYFSTTVPSSQYKGLEKYFVQEGLAYRGGFNCLAEPSVASVYEGEQGHRISCLRKPNSCNGEFWGADLEVAAYSVIAIHNFLIIPADGVVSTERKLFSRDKV